MIHFMNHKLACQVCIRGHRGRSCDHVGRRLLLVPDKGRPQSQCDTCRSTRASTHHRCICRAIAQGLRRSLILSLVSCTPATFVLSLDLYEADYERLTKGAESVLAIRTPSNHRDVNVTLNEIQVVAEILDIDMEAAAANPCRCSFGEEWYVLLVKY